MRLGPVAIAAAAMFGWAVASPQAAPDGAAANEGKPLIEHAEPALEPSGAASDPIDRVGRGFVAITWRPGTLGDPDALLEQAVLDAVDRAHRRISPADLDAEAGDAHPTLAVLDSGWDDFSTISPEHQLRRLRQLANLLAERAPTNERLVEVDVRTGAEVVISGRSDDMFMLRLLKEAFKSVQNGTFFTPERIAIIGALLLAVVMLTRLRHLRGR
jgi:hypothetical protein